MPSICPSELHPVAQIFSEFTRILTVLVASTLVEVLGKTSLLLNFKMLSSWSRTNPCWRIKSIPKIKSSSIFTTKTIWCRQLHSNYSWIYFTFNRSIFPIPIHNHSIGGSLMSILQGFITNIAAPVSKVVSIFFGDDLTFHHQAIRILGKSSYGKSPEGYVWVSQNSSPTDN